MLEQLKKIVFNDFTKRFWRPHLLEMSVGAFLVLVFPCPRGLIKRASAVKAMLARATSVNFIVKGMFLLQTAGFDRLFLNKARNEAALTKIMKTTNSFFPRSKLMMRP